MAEIEKLEAIARAATQGIGQSQFTHPRDHNRWQANAAFARAFDAPTVLALLAVVRAAKHVAYSNGFDAALPDKEDTLRAALAAFDALEQT